MLFKYVPLTYAIRYFFGQEHRFRASDTSLDDYGSVNDPWQYVKSLPWMLQLIHINAHYSTYNAVRLSGTILTVHLIPASGA